MSHFVKCLYCGEKFDRDKIAYELVSARRYAHKECAQKHREGMSQDELDLAALNAYIKNIYGNNYIDAQIKKQIRQYREEYNYTYSGMLKTLQYCFEIKGISRDPKYGIGIVPYMFNEARNYYYKLFLAKNANANKDMTLYKPKMEIVEIPMPVAKVKQARLMFDDDDFLVEQEV